MDLQLVGIQSQLIKAEVIISGSKSESNRLLILQQQFPNLLLKNVSDSDDTYHLQEALSSKNDAIDIGHAGTAMRFLTAYFAAQPNRTRVLSGSERMHNRPIKILVDALRDLGAEVTYLKKEGYPPLQIAGKPLTTNFVKVNGNVSSQYVSALLLIAPGLPKGLTIELEGKITSMPYITMTLRLLNQLGVEAVFHHQKIKVKPLLKSTTSTIVVESDWSSASYFYSVIALSKVGSQITLSSYKKESLQADAILPKIYTTFGVETHFTNNSILLKKASDAIEKQVDIDLNKAPDIAQTIAVTCFGLGVRCQLTGLHTLKIKETDRLEALQHELTKLGAKITVTHHSLTLEKRGVINSNVAIKTYKDHRMAMAFAPLAMLVPLTILDAKVVTKSYRNFWQDLKNVGFQINEQ